MHSNEVVASEPLQKDVASEQEQLRASEAKRPQDFANTNSEKTTTEKTFGGGAAQSLVKTTTKSSSPNDQPAIETFGLTKRYGQRLSVENLNLKIFPGELYALLGDNGAGKTTAIGLLTTLLKPTSGTFRICGFDGIKQAEKTKGAFGIVSQDVSIYGELTALENLQFVADLYNLPKNEAKERIEYLLNTAGLADRANDVVMNFSGGMQRKLSIAGALLHQPKVLFMDEPTVGLDPQSRRQIWASLKQLQLQGVTILLTTHYLEEAEVLANRIGIIRLGKLVAEGTIEELKEKIQAIRTIEVRLSQTYESEAIFAKLKALNGRFPGKTQFHPTHNMLSFAQPKDMNLEQSIQIILGWLNSENLAFSKFSTSEPSLEDVFFALSNSNQTLVSTS